MIVYSNSCSFGEPQGHLVYADYVAAQYDATVINAGQASASNRRIIRNSLRDLDNIKSPCIVALVGLTFITRTELWQPHLPAIDNDGHFHSIKIDDSNLSWPEGLINTIVPNVVNLTDPEVREYYRQWLIHYNPEAVLTDLITDIIMFVTWCRSRGIKLVLFNNAELWPKEPAVGLTSPFIKSLSECMLSDDSIINPWETSFTDYSLKLGFEPKDADQYGIHGHPGAEAHEAWAKVLMDYLPNAISVC